MNIGEIARRAGVSRSTVSYALSGNRPVSEETRRRIQAVIDELGYRPNASARALKEGRTRTLGLVIPPASQRLTDMQLGFVASVVEAAARADFDVLLSPSGGDHDRSFERIVTGRRVDGVILMEIRLEDARVDPAAAAPGCRSSPSAAPATPEDMWWVDVDYAGAGRALRAPPGRPRPSAHRPDQPLRRAGRRRLRPRPPRPGRLRRGGRPARPDQASTSAAPTTHRPGRRACERLLADHPEVTARGHHQRGRAARHPARPRTTPACLVPRDFSITGVVAQHWAEDFRPPLTAADVPAHDMGARAVELLLERIATPEAHPRHVLIAPPISLRNTTGPARARRLTP